MICCLVFFQLLVGCSTVPPVTQSSDYTMSCENLKYEISTLEDDVDNLGNIRMGQRIVGLLIMGVGAGVGMYNDSWEAVGGSYVGGDMIYDWNKDEYENKKSRLTHLKQLSYSKGCY
jgi:hypothetical protein